MPVTLSFGYVKPVSGDRGAVFWPALEDNIIQLNNHNHDGADSARLTTAATEVLTSSIASGSWVSQGNGTYKQTITLPATVSEFNKVMVNFKDSSGNYYHLKTARVTATTYDVYINDNSVSLTAVYTS